MCLQFTELMNLKLIVEHCLIRKSVRRCGDILHFFLRKSGRAGKRRRHCHGSWTSWAWGGREGGTPGYGAAEEQTCPRNCNLYFDSMSWHMISLYVSPICTSFQRYESTHSFQSCKEILKYSPILFLGSCREDSRCQRFILFLFFFFFFVEEALCLTLKWFRPSCKIVGQVWATVHWTIIFFNWILLLLGKSFLQWWYREPENKSLLSSHFPSQDASAFWGRHWTSFIKHLII